MEVVGALASFIAIGQAISAGPKAFRLLKGVISPGREVEELSNELARMECYYQYISAVIKPFSDTQAGTNLLLHVPEPPYMKRLRLELQDLSCQLDKRVRECAPTTSQGGKFKVHRKRWLMEKSEIKRLRDTCARLTRELEAAMIPYVLLVQGHTSHAATSTIQSLVEALEMVKHTDCKSQERIAPEDSDDDVRLATPTDSVSSLCDPVGNDISTNPKVETPVGEKRVKDQEDVCIHQLARCKCNCHRIDWHGSSQQTQQIVSKTLAVLDPQTAASSCHACPCSPKPKATRFRLRCPLPFGKGSVLASFTLESSLQICISLRPVASIPNEHKLWPTVFQSRLDSLQYVMSRHGLCITDEGPGRLSILETIIFNDFALFVQNLGMLAHLTKQASNDDAKRSAAWLCLWMSKNLDWLSADDCYRLRQFSDLLDDEIVHHRQWEVYDAIRDDKDLSDFRSWTREELITFRNNADQTFLHTACKSDNVAAAKHLLWLGADADARSRRRETPLHLACRYFSEACVEVLLAHGCDVNARSLWDCTPLMWAVRCTNPGASRMMRPLLEHGASPTRADVDGWTVLHCMAQANITVAEAVERLELLCEYGARGLLNTKNVFGTVPIIATICWHNHCVLEAYLKAGARTDIVVDGRSVLHHAASYGTREVMDVLARASISGIDPRSRSTRGYTAMDEFRWRTVNVRNRDEGYRGFRVDTDLIVAFERLMCSVKDRAMSLEAAQLKEITSLLQKGNIPMAESMLRQMRAQKDEAGIVAEAETLRVVGIQIAQDMIEPAVESLQEMLEYQHVRFEVVPTPIAEKCPSYDSANPEGPEDMGDFDDYQAHTGLDREADNDSVSSPSNSKRTLRTPYNGVTNLSQLDARKSLGTRLTMK